MFQRFEWCPSVELLRVAKLQGWRHQSDRTATAKAAKKMFFSRVSEATLGSFSGHFWDVLGAKLGGVSAFRVVSIGRAVARCKIARLKASKRQESYHKGSQKDVFLWFQKRPSTLQGRFYKIHVLGRGSWRPEGIKKTNPELSGREVLKRARKVSFDSTSFSISTNDN